MISGVRTFLLFACLSSALAAQSPTAEDRAGDAALTGTLRFQAEYDGMVTPMRYYSDGKHLRVELGEEGNPYLIWIRGIQGMDGIAALNPMVKNYSIEFDGPPMWDRLNSDGSIDKRRPPKVPDIPPGTPVEYMGFDCFEYDLNTDGPDTTVLMLENADTLPFLLTRLWKNLADASPHLQVLAKRHDGIPLRIERKKWSRKAFFLLELKSYDPAIPNPSIFKIPSDYYQIPPQIRKNRSSDGGGRGR